MLILNGLERRLARDIAAAWTFFGSPVLADGYFRCPKKNRIVRHVSFCSLRHHFSIFFPTKTKIISFSSCFSWLNFRFSLRFRGFARRLRRPKMPLPPYSCCARRMWTRSMSRPAGSGVDSV